MVLRLVLKPATSRVLQVLRVDGRELLGRLDVRRVVVERLVALRLQRRLHHGIELLDAVFLGTHGRHTLILLH